MIFCNFFLKNFENININFKHKSFNLELFFYYIHLVRIIKECFTREKENNIDIDSTRKELNTYVINNKNIFLDFEINLIDSLTDILFIQNSVEDNIETPIEIVEASKKSAYTVFYQSEKDNKERYQEK